jgi:hypothetical protein
MQYVSSILWRAPKIASCANPAHQKKLQRAGPAGNQLGRNLEAFGILLVSERLEWRCGKRDTCSAFGEQSRPKKRSAVAMTEEEEGALREQLARLQQEHRDLDAAIAALAASPGSDLLQVQRLKKRKLVLRDAIRQIEDQLTPVIIA